MSGCDYLTLGYEIDDDELFSRGLTGAAVVVKDEAESTGETDHQIVSLPTCSTLNIHAYLGMK